MYGNGICLYLKNGHCDTLGCFWLTWASFVPQTWQPWRCVSASALSAAGNATTPLLWGVSNLGQSTPLKTMFTPCLHFIFLFSQWLVFAWCFSLDICVNSRNAQTFGHSLKLSLRRFQSHNALHERLSSTSIGMNCRSAVLAMCQWKHTMTVERREDAFSVVLSV